MTEPVDPVAPTHLPSLLAALSRALDLTEGLPMGHGVRACYIALRLADALGLPVETRDDLHLTMLLKDAGCSSNAARMHQLFGGDEVQAKYDSRFCDWPQLVHGVRYALAHAAPGARLTERLARLAALSKQPERVMDQLTALRCERGAQVARSLGLGEPVAEAIYHLDEHWDGRGAPHGRRRDAIPLLARLACLAQTVEVFHARDGRDAALEMVRRRAGRWFDPPLARTLEALGESTRFWNALEDRAAEAVEDATSPTLSRRLALVDVDTVCTVFAQIVDAKSPYTADHSRRVAGYAVEIGVALGVGRDIGTGLRRAGLLHDLGKLGVPSAVLEKPEGLDADEWAIVRRHPEWTVRVLSELPELAWVRRVAAAHHEKLDGSGYWRGLGSAQLDRPMRILAVADIWDALTADRPYRPGMDPDRALAVLRTEAGPKLDTACVDALAGLGAPVDLPRAA